jgi:hypothetical protein
VQQEPRSILRTVVSPVGNSTPTQISERRDVVCVRLTPTLRQRYEEALIEVRRCEESVRSHPGWQYAEQEAGQEGSRPVAKRVGGRAQRGVSPHRVINSPGSSLGPWLPAFWTSASIPSAG